MDPVIDELASKIANRRCVLFAGSGINSATGGASWKDLVTYLKKELEYDSPLEDNFEIVGDMILDHGKEKVNELVKKRLENTKLSNSVEKLTGLPWFTVFTTNYDLSLFDSLKKNQEIQVIPVETGKEFVLTGIDSELLYVKLMGGVDCPFDCPGHMILDKSDLEKASVERVKVFEILDNHLANLSFLFVGYSFDDDLVTDTIERLMKSTGCTKTKYYAVFRSKPNEQKAYRLKKCGVQVIISDINEFSNKLYEVVTSKPVQNISVKNLPVGEDNIPVKTSKIGKFLEYYQPILAEDLYLKTVKANHFFLGSADSLNPFHQNWQFKRDEVSLINSEIIRRKNKNLKGIIIVEGSPGAGRRFIILSTVYELITKHKALAIRLQKNSPEPFKYPEYIESFYNEVKNEADRSSYSKPELLVFSADFSLDNQTIFKFQELSERFEFPVFLIYEDSHSSGINSELSSIKGSIVRIDADSNLSIEQRSKLGKYISEAIQTHHFPESSNLEIEEAIEKNQKFLPIIYKFIDPAKRSINFRIEEEFKNLSPIATKCVMLCALSTVMDLEMPINVLRKALAGNIIDPEKYDLTFDIAEEAGSFVDYREDSINQYFYVYHTVVADHLVKLQGPKKMDEYLLILAKIIDLRYSAESDFISSLLIENKSRLSGAKRPFTDEGIEKALLEIKNRQPATPILHHLARFYFNQDFNDPRIIPLLNEALIEPKESYALTERRENILTTLAASLWRQKKERLLRESRDNQELIEIIDLLKRAREGVWNTHPYFVHAKIVNELAENKNSEEKFNLFCEAITELVKGIDQTKDDYEGYQKLNLFLIEILSKIDIQQAERYAEGLLEKKEGIGYYALARVGYNKLQDSKKANKYLDLCLSAEKYPPMAVVLKMEILLSEVSPDYSVLLQLANRHSSVTSENSWKSAFFKGIAFFVNGKTEDAWHNFQICIKLAPRLSQRTSNYYWMEKGSKKLFKGITADNLTDIEGHIYRHTIYHYSHHAISFDPRKQTPEVLKPRLDVTFEINFLPRGPVAVNLKWDKIR